MLTQQKTTKLYQIFQVCTQRYNFWTRIRHFPSSGLNPLFICLLVCIQLFFLCSQVTLTCLIRVAVERKTQQTVTKTYKKYLPPIPAKVTESSTIVKYLRYFQKLAEQVNLTYVILVEDMKVVQNCPEEFGNVIIHPGHFQVMEENFQVNMDSYVCSFIIIQSVVFNGSLLTMMFLQIGYYFLILRSWVRLIYQLVANTGSEDIVCQSGYCSFGNINGVLAASHYNRPWIVHSDTICYLRLMSHAVYHCAVVIVQQQHSGLRVRLVT